MISAKRANELTSNTIKSKDFKQLENEIENQIENASKSSQYMTSYKFKTLYQRDLFSTYLESHGYICEESGSSVLNISWKHIQKE